MLRLAYCQRIVLKKPIKARDNGTKPVPDIKPKKNKERLERGVETLFRTASSNHMRLSGMADNKAHILLTLTPLSFQLFCQFLPRK